MKGTGILIDDDYELQLRKTTGPDGKITGGLVVGRSLYQNQALILILNPGAVRSAPAVGVGIDGALLDNDFAAWRRKIRQQLELDGQKVNDIKFSNPQNLTIDASYRNS